MRTGVEGLNLIKSFEGLELTAYYCPAGVLTIGYGHTDAAGPPKVMLGMQITELEANRILREDLKKYEQAVDKSVRVPLSQNQFDALVSFTFNCGIGALQKSTLLKKLNRGEYDSVPAELMKWNKAGGRELAGLTRRRRAEAKMWRGIDSAQPVAVTESRVAPDKPKPKKTIVQSREANAAAAGGAISLMAAGAEATGHGKQIADSFEIPLVLVLLVLGLVFAAIWYFRRERLEENGE